MGNTSVHFRIFSFGKFVEGMTVVLSIKGSFEIKK